MPQTSVLAQPLRALPGLLADAAFNDCISCIVDQVAAIRPGLVVVRTANGAFAAAAPLAAATMDLNVLGVSVLTQKALDLGGGPDTEFYEDDSTMPVLRHGRVNVLVEDAYTPASSVFVRVATGSGGTVIGSIRTSADTSTALAWAQARFLTSGGAGSLAVLEVNI